MRGERGVRKKDGGQEVQKEGGQEWDEVGTDGVRGGRWEWG